MDSKIYSELNLKDNKLLYVIFNSDHLSFKFYDLTIYKAKYNGFLLYLTTVIATLLLNMITREYFNPNLLVQLFLITVLPIFIFIIQFTILYYYEQHISYKISIQNEPKYLKQFCIHFDSNGCDKGYVEINQFGLLFDRKGYDKSIIRQLRIDPIQIFDLKEYKRSKRYNYIRHKFLLVGLTNNNEIVSIIPSEIDIMSDEIINQKTTVRNREDVFGFLLSYLELLEDIYDKYPYLTNKLYEVDGQAILATNWDDQFRVKIKWPRLN